jgi:hypothetical protein
MAGLVDYIPPFLPTKPKTKLDYYSFPNDLVSDGRQFCMDIQFLEYDSSLTNIGMFFPTLSSGIFNTAAFTPSGGITLPIPKKLNDIQTVIWESTSATSAAAGAVMNMIPNAMGRLGAFSNSGAAADVVGALIPGGLAVNPHLFMLFKQPTFKEYSFSWTFAPKNEQESITLAKIIDYFKFNMLPQAAGGLGGLGQTMGLNYPNIAMIKMYPNDLFTFRFKPCAVKSVQVDYTGSGAPSFFKRTGAPTIVNFTILLQEIQYNIKDNYYA